MDVSSILAAPSTSTRPAFSKEVPVEFDLGHLLVSDSNPLDAQAFRNEKEAYLLSNTTDDIQLLVNSIFELPTKTDDDGVMAQLPEPLFDLPREKPLPAPKVLTKWQKFANTKGIAPKPKRDRMVFDEEKGEWVPRWGYKGKNKELDDQWLVEVPLGKDVDYDPVSEDRKERKERKLKNDQQRLKNAARASQQLQSKDGAARSAPSASDRTERRAALDRQLLTTKSSTASRGKFDKTLEGEPKSKGLKRKFEPTEISASDERKNSLRVLKDLEKKTESQTSVVNTRKAIRNNGGAASSASRPSRGGKRKT